MAAVTKDLVKVNDVCGPIVESTGRITHIGMFIGAGAVGTFLIEICNQSTNAVPSLEEWVAISLESPQGTVVASLVAGASALYGTASVHGAVKARIRKSAGADGASRVTMTTNVGGMS